MTPPEPKKKLTIRRLWDYLGADYTIFPNWPPDLFAMCAAVLKKSGAYTTIVNPFDKDATRAKSVHGEDGPVEIGAAWRAALDIHGSQPLPDSWMQEKPLEGLNRRWVIVHGRLDSEIFRVADDRALLSSLMDLLAISDEACTGLGLPIRPIPVRKGKLQTGRDNGAELLFREEADATLFPKQFGSTLCKAIDASAARVLPKMHTAQTGLTIRSFSHHLAYCESDEVRPSWISVPGSRGDATDTSHMNILIAPWPRTILPKQISEVKENPEIHCHNSFAVDILSTGGDVVAECEALVNAAEKLVGQIDAVLFPELALTTRDYRLVRSTLLRRGILSIAGIGSKSRSTNYLAIDVPISKHHAVHFRQRKHHRWKLDKSQIDQYHLGSRLMPEKHYWEHIDVQDRQLKFIVLRPWLVATALICEDLARHDPVGELIKGVGPNLVMALLMDGPQITERWSSRYAAGLADDPGCSVLSVTSLGMAQLSRPRGGGGKSPRAVALWKDAFSGAPTEIDIPKEQDGVVITLAMRRREEKTADYRTDYGLASYPSLAGYHFVKLPAPLPLLAKRPEQPGWISPSDAEFLGRLAQRDSLHPDFMPRGLDDLRDAAFRIGREIWRNKTDGPIPPPNKLDPKNWASAAEQDTAQQILNWHKTNQEP